MQERRNSIANALELRLFIPIDLNNRLTDYQWTQSTYMSGGGLTQLSWSMSKLKVTELICLPFLAHPFVIWNVHSSHCFEYTSSDTRMNLDLKMFTGLD